MDPLSIADVFQSDLFSTTSLTAAINEIAYVPQRLSDLGLFEVSGIPTTTAFVEKVGETLALVSNTPRGGPGQSVAIDRRNAIPFTAAHLQLEDRIYADEIQNVRGFGTNQLAGVGEVRDARLLKMSRSLDLTLEYHRLGAVQGLVLDADGTTVIADLFDMFGITPRTAVTLNTDVVGDPTAIAAVIKPLITGALRDVDADLGGFTPSGYLVLAGDALFDSLEAHPELRDTLRFQNGVQMRDDGRRSFTYGGVTWENYRGTGAVAIPTDEGRLIPLGVPGLFQQMFAPADTMAAVNTMGQVKYALAAPDPSGKDKYIELESQSNPITYCTRPKVLRKFLRT